MAGEIPIHADQRVQCEVTGEWVPADETVVIQGKRVSGRGKQLLLEQLRSGEALPGELEAPSKLRRFGCAFLDNILLGVLGAFVGFASVMMAGGATGVQGLAMLLAAGVGIAYFGVMHSMGGQTLGKKAGKIKVINLDGSEISTGTAFVRALGYQGLGLIPPVFYLVGEDVEAMLMMGGIAQLVAGVYGLANAVTVLVSKDQRAIHDMIAKTKVIQIDA